MKFIFLILVIMTSSAHAEDKKWTGFVNYAPWDMWMPGKFGASIDYKNNLRSYELMFQRASYNLDVVISGLAGVSENRLTFLTRSHSFDNSFNFHYGTSINLISAHLGKEYIGGIGAKYDLVSVNTLGLMWGFGNRFDFNDKYKIGIDWFKMIIPVMNLKSESSFLDESNNKIFYQFNR